MNQKIICLLRTTILCYLISFLLISACAAVVWKSGFSASQMKLAIYAVYAVSCLCGGFFAGRKLQEKRILWGMASGLIYFVVLIALSVILTHAVPTFSSKALLTLGLCLIGSIIGAVIS